MRTFVFQFKNQKITKFILINNKYIFRKITHNKKTRVDSFELFYKYSYLNFVKKIVFNKIKNVVA